MLTRYALCLTTVFLGPVALVGQTLNNGNLSPVVGEVFTTNLATYLAPGSAGASQTWNFAALDILSSSSITYVTPASTGQGASFPGSNVAANIGQGNFGFYQTSAAGWDIAGVYSSSLQAPIIYQNPERVLSYPCSYNSTWTDQFSADFSSGGIPILRAGSITGTADGFGTLVLPTGTVTNVLRVRTVEDYTDELTDIGTIAYDFTTYNWYKPGVHNPLLTVSEQTTNTLGQANSTQTANWLATANVGFEELFTNAIGIDLFPNPSSDQVTVIFSSAGGTLNVEIMDATGRVAHQNTLSSNSGISQHQLDVSGLASGLYQVRIADQRGQRGVKQLLVQ